MPRRQRHMNLVGPQLEAMEKIAESWIQRELAKEGVSPWSSPAFPVAKKGGRWRGVVDFCWLNENTLANGYPLPRIEDILTTMGRKKVFSVLDLKDAFHQIPMHRDSRALTATSTRKGLLNWQVLAQGLKNRTPGFLRVVNNVLQKCK